jgi:hypothetical protein
MRHGLLILVSAAAVACTAPPEPRLARMNEPFRLAVGQSAVVGDVSVRFVEVSGDSRCPRTVVCVWEGDGAVLVEVRPASGTVTADTLHTGLDPRALDLGEITLELVGLDPYPEAPGRIPADDYVATFVVR